MLDFQLLNRKRLLDFVESPAYNSLSVLPISRQRALSYTRNPRANDEDILLIIAYSEGEIVGYLGLLPDVWHVSDSEEYAFAWLSTIWLAPNMRGKGLGEALTRHGIAAYQGRVFATEFVPAIEKMYHKTKAFAPEALASKGIRCYLRANFHHILPPKKPIFKKLKPALSLADALLNVFFDLRLRFFSVPKTSLRIEYITEVDAEIGEFIARLDTAHAFKRRTAELNWLLKNPWILSAPLKDTTANRYHFSATDRDFGFYALAIRDAQNQLKAFVILSKRNDIVKIPYLFIENIDIEAIANIIELHLSKWKISQFTTFQPALLAYYEKNASLAWHQRHVFRYYLIAHERAAAYVAGNYALQDGDGDCAFT